MRSKCILSEDCESDHMSLLRAFQSWQASGNGEEFCSDYNLSQVSHYHFFNSPKMVDFHSAPLVFLT